MQKPHSIYTTIALAVCAMLFATLFVSCSKGDEPPVDAGTDEGFSIVTSQPNRMTLKVDASDFGTWIYVSLKNKTLEKLPIPLACEGEWDGKSGISLQEVNGDNYTLLSMTKTDAQPEPADWDFALHRFDVRTNRGAVAATNLTSLGKISSLSLSGLQFTPDTWSTSRVMVDISDMMAYHIGYQNIASNAVLSDWIRMDISTPPPVFRSTGLVYIMRLKDGSKAALQMRSYMNISGKKGFLTIDIVYPLQ